MKKADFIKKFHLYKSPLKAVFHDGNNIITRTLYFQKDSDTCYVFYLNDLATFRKYDDESITEAYKTGFIHGRTGAYYSWYHDWK